MTPLLWGFEEREELMGFMSAPAGRASMPPISAPAACIRPSQGLLDEIADRAERFPAFINDLETLLTDNRSSPAHRRYRDHHRGGGARPGIAGPARGSGIAWDLRKSQPHDAYAEMNFDVPIGKTDDCYARYPVRIEEMRQSLKIIRQCIDNA